MAYSTQRSVSDGTLQLLMIEIDFFDKSEITAYFDNIPTTAFTWATDKSLRFNAPVPQGIEVLLRRTTDLSEPRHIFSQGAQFKDSTLDEDFKQILHIAQEAVEGANVGDIYQTLNMHGNVISNVGPAVADGDAVSLGQVKRESESAWVAARAAQAAQAGVAQDANRASAAVTASEQSNVASKGQADRAKTEADKAAASVATIGDSVAVAKGHADQAGLYAQATSKDRNDTNNLMLDARRYAGGASGSAAEAAISAASVNLPAFAGKGGFSLVANAAGTAWELVERVTKAAFDVLVARVTSLEARPRGLGDGQTWQDVRAARGPNTWWVNDTGRSIDVRIVWSQASSLGTRFYVRNPAGVEFNLGFGQQVSVAGGGSVGSIVPAGWSYRLVLGNSLDSWFELR